MTRTGLPFQGRQTRVFAWPGIPQTKANEAAAVWVTYAATTPVVKAELSFTKDSGRWQDRKWESVAAELVNGRATAGLPDGTRVYYMNLFDQRGCATSGKYVELPAE